MDTTATQGAFLVKLLKHHLNYKQAKKAFDFDTGNYCSHPIAKQ